LLVKRYGIETLIESVALLRDRIPGIHLEIMGAGEYRPELEAMVDRLDLRTKVSFIGYLPFYEMVAPRLLQADIGVVPLWNDFQLCNKLVDYLALSIPTITTASAATQPYLDGDAVFYVKPRDPEALADAILALYLDPARRAAMGTAGHAAYRRHFAWDTTRSSYLAIYQSLPCSGSQEVHPIRDQERVEAAP
jgi:glycosyltransferase involved in cell wall biosynthesis